jgi:hypothetical protein
MLTVNPSRNTPDRMDDLPFVGLATFARQPGWMTITGSSRATSSGR